MKKYSFFYSGCDVLVSEWQAGIGKIPELNINYSDHEAVIARISVTKREGDILKYSINLHFVLKGFSIILLTMYVHLYSACSV